MSGAAPISLGEPGLLDPEQISLVRRHLTEILASAAFAGSRRTQDFLRLIVGHALDGEIDNLRERMIGAEMFGRPISYDTGSDSVVRVRASEVRKKLAQFYGSANKDQLPVWIELPSGCYVPRFHFQSDGAAGSAAAVSGASVSGAPWSGAPASSANSHAAASGAPSAIVSAPVTVAASVSVAASPRRLILRWPATGAIGAALLLIFAFVGFRWWNRSSIPPAGIHSIAILPLENLSGSPDQEYFSDGITEELINDLGQISTLRVISLTSSMSYKGTKKKLPEIARELSVDGVVEGGVLHDGNQVRISVQLIDARADRPVWAHTYTRDLTGVLDWQGEVAKTIAEEISTEISPQEQARLAHRRPIDSEAQDFFLHGILLRQADDCKSAINYFNHAIEKDPSYAEAHSALASCYGRLGESGRMPYEQAFTQQKAEALRAVELDDTLSEAHAELGNTAMTLDHDWPAAEAQFHRALELNPNSATSHEKYAFFLVRNGQFRDAISEIERSVDLDPVSESTFHAEGFIYYFSRRYDQALAVTRTVQGLKINLPDWDFLIGDIYAEKDMLSESIAAFLRSGDGPYTLGHLGNAYARAGQTDAARRTIARLQEDVEKNGVGRYEIALIYAGLGEKDEAFHWLEDAFRAHDVGLVYLQVDPCLDPLRSDPRFTDLLRRVGLSQ
jgi:TolB-like protein/tetratricopeptide (TPR) repeat protein